MSNPNQRFVRLRTKFAALYKRTGEIHKGILAAGKPTQGHGRDHDLMVAMYAALIAEDETVAEQAFVAALVHSFDRHFPTDELERLTEECLKTVEKEFTVVELLEISEAVELHSRQNADDDNPVTVALKDADRLANIGAINLIRGGQHRPNIPAILPETIGGLNPASTFKNPTSCYDATFYNLEWEAMLRLPKAQELGAKYFAFIREFHRLVQVQFEEVGLHPFPAEGP